MVLAATGAQMKRNRTGRGAQFWSAFAVLSATTLFWAIFALLSGAEEFGGGWGGLVRNAPNAVPWVVLIAVLIVSFRTPMWGGLLFVAAGLFSIVQFDTYRHVITFAMITLPFVVGGAVLAHAGWRARC